MPKPLSDTLFTFQRDGAPSLALERCSARDLGLGESWFRDAIFATPELVIGPCRAAGVTDDDWYSWAREFRVEVGSIDVLLISSQGRVAIVETKLSTNPELRRRVLAQALDYLTHLSDALDASMPSIPIDANGDFVADVDDIQECVQQGDVLVIIVSDDVDPRVAKLSRSLIADNLVKEWDLALIDLALYRTPGAISGEHLVVPHVRNLVWSEPRQVVRVVVQGERPSARIVVERVTREPEESGRQKWNEAQFFAALETKNVSLGVRELAAKLGELALQCPESVSLWWGTGSHGSMVLKRSGYSLIQINGSGEIRFRPSQFRGALGEDVAGKYRAALESLAPQDMGVRNPRLRSSEAARLAPQLYDLIERSLKLAQGRGLSDG